MASLDDVIAMKQLDKVNVLGSIEQLGGQCQQAWEEVTAFSFPENFKHVSSIIFSGMGGSALGAYVMKSLFFENLPVPFEIINDYHLPPYANEKTLVILASYSGTTEETISCAEEAISKKCQVTGLTTGGKLAEILKSIQAPAYIFLPKHNPSNQPRLGTGYSVLGQIAIFKTLGLLSINDADVSETVSVLEKGNTLYGVTIPAEKNSAKQLAQKWVGKIPIIVAAEFLTHVGRVIRNQLHESAKSFAAYHEIPELNHHLMEGLKNPTSNKDILRFLFITSPLYSEKNAKRVRITKDVVTKNGIGVDEFVPQSKSKIAQALESVQFGAYVNYYMAVLYDLDPSLIPWVDYFKAELAKS